MNETNMFWDIIVLLFLCCYWVLLLNHICSLSPSHGLKSKWFSSLIEWSLTFFPLSSTKNEKMRFYLRTCKTIVFHFYCFVIIWGERGLLLFKGGEGQASKHNHHVDAKRCCENKWLHHVDYIKLYAYLFI